MTSVDCKRLPAHRETGIMDRERSDRAILHLVRHGAADGAEGRCVGQVDVPLSESGRADVAQLAATWTGDAPPGRLVSSDLSRAADSARRLAAAWGVDASAVATDARLREMDFGAWDGATWDAIERDDADRLTAWMADWVTTPAPDGECFRDVVDRVTAWLDAVRTSGPAPVVAATHAGAIRAAVCHALGLPLANAFRIDVDPASVTTLRATPQGWAVAGTNAKAFPAVDACVRP